MTRIQEIEKSIIKKYRKEIWTKFIKAVKEYYLIKENDKIAVCISGGKDSFLLAKCMQELQKYSDVKFELEFITMNPGYHTDDLNILKANADLLNIPLHIFNTNIFEVISKHAAKEPCYMCAKMRRGSLYAKAKEFGCNKIALGHHYDDVIETTLLNILYNGSFQTMLPKVKALNFDVMQLIRPLYLVEEKSIKNWVKYNELNFMACGCMITVNPSASKRNEVKKLIADLEKTNPFVKNNLFSSTSNVYMNAILGYKNGKEKIDLLKQDR
ncbi:MAG: ATP-binding protein [Bacilli bacterium]|nr:ATP-binding protein [Bacilli bacterium]